MNAIHWTGVDGLLNAFSGVTVLANGTGSTVPGLHNKSVGSHVGAVPTADARGLIDPDSLLPQRSSQKRFTT